MSRLSNIFHSTCQSAPTTASTSATNPISAVCPTKTGHTDAEPVDIAAVTAESITSDFNKIIDGLKPKLKEIIQEIINEENKVRDHVQECDPIAALKKLPVLPTLASNLPEGVKSKLKACIEAAAEKLATKPIKISNLAVPETAEGFVDAAATEAPKEGCFPLPTKITDGLFGHASPVVNPAPTPVGAFCPIPHKQPAADEAAAAVAADIASSPAISA